MKNKNFLNGLVSKLAVAVMALTGCLFTSCEEEDFNATYETSAATAYITVSLADENGSTLLPSSITSSVGTVSGSTITITGNKTISAQTVTVTITYGDITEQGTVQISAQAAGTVAYYSIAFIYFDDQIITNTDTSTVNEYKIVKGDSESVESIAYLSGSYSHDGYTHDGITEWSENATDYLLDVVVTYPVYSGQEIPDVPEVNDEAAQDLFDALNVGIIESEGTLSFTVSAWSLYAAWVTVTTTTTYYTINKITTVNGVDSTETVAAFSLVTKSVLAEYTETAHPDHSGSYEYGHGHGSSSNAGGGIVISD